MVGAAAFRTSLPFYLRRPVPLLSRDGHELTSNYVVAMRQRFFGSPYWRAESQLRGIIDADPEVLALAVPGSGEEWSRRAGLPLSTLASDRETIVLRAGG